MKASRRNRGDAGTGVFFDKKLVIAGLILVVSLLAALNIFSYRHSSHMVRTHVPQMDASMEIKLKTTTGHLWFEEILSGDREESLEKVWDHYDSAVWYTRAMLEGGINPKGTILPVEDEKVRGDIREVLEKLTLFREVTQARIDAQAGPGTDIDQEYDAAFRDLIGAANKVEVSLKSGLAREMRFFRRSQFALVTGELLFGLFAVGFLAVLFARIDRAGKKLAESEEKYKKLFSNEIDAITIFDVETKKIIDVNESFLKLYGYTRDEVLRMTAGDFSAEPENTDEAIRKSAVAGSTHIPVRLHKKKDGAVITVELAAGPFALQGRDVMYAVIRDVTERVKAEEETKRAKEFLQTVIDGFPEQVMVLDREYRVELSNRAAKEVFGVDEFDSGDQYCYRILHHRDSPCEGEEHICPLEDVIESGKVVTVEHIHHDKNGCRIDVEIIVAPIFDANGEVVKIIESSRDITERKRSQEEKISLERQIQHAQKLESLGVLAGGIAHDFNNILMGVLGNAELALLDLPPESPVLDSVKNIQVSALRAAELSRQMLAYSGRGKFVITAVNLNRLIDEIVHLIKTAISRTVVLKYNFAANVLPVEGDATQLRQVLMNLITNASDAIGERSGVISLSTGVIEASRDYLSTTYINDELPEGFYSYFEVSDTGCGMDAETRRKLFDPFFTTKFIGRGLGLAAVLGIVRGHKGTIRVYSEVGKGTTIKVLLPCMEGEEEPRPEDEETATVVVEGAREAAATVLVVDDEETVLSVARKGLERFGFTVLTAGDGREGVEVFKEHQDEIDVVVLDMTMPHMGGEEAFREMRRLRSDVRVILSSGYNEQDAVGYFAGKGLAGFIQKPYSPVELKEKLLAVLQGNCFP